MPYEFKFLEETEMEDMLVDTYEAWERDKYMHEKNLERYNAILSQLDPADLQRETDAAFEIEAKRRANPKRANMYPFTPLQFLIINHRDTGFRLEEVDSYLGNTEPQLPTGQRLEDAKTRLKERKARRQQGG